MRYFVYILRCSDNTLYTGISNDLKKRMATHKLGKGSKYVRARLPFKLIYFKQKDNKSSALKEELFIKKLSKLEKEDLISKKITGKLKESIIKEINLDL